MAVARADRTVAEVWAELGGPAAAAGASPAAAAAMSVDRGRRTARGARMSRRGPARPPARRRRPPPSAPARSARSTRRGAWLPPVLAVVLVVLAGGLLLRAGGPALWARATARPSGARPAVRGGRRARPVRPAVPRRCACSPRCTPRATRSPACCRPRTSLADLAGVLADGVGRAPRAGDPGPAPDRPARPHGAVRRADRRDGGPGGRRGPPGGRRPAWACSSSTASRSRPSPAASGWSRSPRRPPGSPCCCGPTSTAGSRRPGAAPRTRLGAGTLAALRIGVAAVLAGLVVGSVVPTLSEGSLDHRSRRGFRRRRPAPRSTRWPRSRAS